MQLQIFQEIKNNLRKARFNLQEVAGSFGDLGTFLPLLMGMVQANGLDFSAGLFFAGFANLITGMTFAIPMAVQPMKAIAAVAITQGLSVQQILAAGIWVSIFVLLLGIFGGINWFIKIIPKNVIRGIQLSLGMTLMIKAVQMVGATPFSRGHDNILIAILAFVLVLATQRSKKIPAAIIIFSAGIILTYFFSPTFIAPKMSIWLPHVYHFSFDDFRLSLFKAALPQVPLTLLNSVIAVCALSADLFPDEKISPKKVAISVAFMNLVSAWFGGMPMCHGSGGLAGQHKFGARTNGSILFLGLLKISLALLFGPTLISLCQHYPHSLLGVLLFFSGINLALVCKDQTALKDILIVLFTAVIGLGTGNIALGFIGGLLVLKVIDFIQLKTKQNAS